MSEPQDPAVTMMADEPAETSPADAETAPAPPEPATAGAGALGHAATAEPVAVGPAGEPLPAADTSLLALVDRLAALLERSDLTELEVEAGGTGITLRKSSAAGGPLVAVAAEAAPASSGEAAAAADPSGAGSGDPTGAAPATRAATPSAVLAPLTGIYYSSPTPGSPPFVVAGAEVVVGQVIGLIEAMKLFNEIKSDRAGRVVRVIAENGALVKAKHPLLEVEPL